MSGAARITPSLPLSPTALFDARDATRPELMRIHRSFVRSSFVAVLTIVSLLAAAHAPANPLEAAGAAQKRLLVVEAPVAVSADVKVLPGQTLRVEPGGVIEIPKGLTLTIEGRLEAGAYRIFSGEGTLTGRGERARSGPGTTCRKFPCDSNGGFVIENLDVQSNQSRIEGIQVR